ncbi:hypothetical protein, partial [Pseudomonas fluorescens]|uniref:hypothetical protein n=1 Tax=Pseudomonas fluorescens TaxID=294 RepID=UPI001F3AFB91
FRFQISDFRKAKCPDKSGHLLLAGADCVFTQPVLCRAFLCRFQFETGSSVGAGLPAMVVLQSAHQ